MSSLSSKTEDYSRKSILSINEFGLDKCPKCKKNICNHTSIVNLKGLLKANEDFSIYSSNLTLKAQNTPSVGAGFATTSFGIDELSHEDLNIYLEENESLFSIDDKYMSCTSNHSKLRYSNQNKTSRPISCNIVVIDNKNNNENNNSNSNYNSTSIAKRKLILSQKSYNELVLKDSLSGAFETSKSYLKKKRILQSQDELTSLNEDDYKKFCKKQNILLMQSSSNRFDKRDLLNEKQHFSRIQSFKSFKSLIISSPPPITTSQGLPEYKSFLHDYSKLKHFNSKNISNIEHQNALVNNLSRKPLAIKKGSSNNNNNNKKHINNKLNVFSSSKTYHSISIVMIIMLLYTINLLQEFFILFDYLNTQKYYWFITSLSIINILQFLIMFCIYLNNSDDFGLTSCTCTNTTLSSEDSSSSASNSSSCCNDSNNSYNYLTTVKNSKNELHPFNFSFIHDGYTNAYKNYTFLFACPLNIILVLIPGLLPIIVYKEFFKYLFQFKTLTCLSHFQKEFCLAFYLLISALFHSLPLTIINSCYLASTTSFASFTYITEMFTWNSLFTNEKRETLVFFISIFISTTVGVCLFTSYYQLMKYMNNDSNANETIRNRNECLIKNNLSKSERKFFFSCFFIIFIRFCYKFCLLTTRLAIIAILWFLFNQSIFILLSMHIAIGYLICFFKYGKVQNFNQNEKEFKTNTLKTLSVKHVSCLMISILSITDSFNDLIDEFSYFPNVHAYYIMYLIQNILVIIVWLWKTISVMQQNQKQLLDKELYVISREEKKEIFVNDNWLQHSVQSVYLVIFLSALFFLLIIGIILKYILTSMTRKFHHQNNRKRTQASL